MTPADDTSREAAVVGTKKRHLGLTGDVVRFEKSTRLGNRRPVLRTDLERVVAKDVFVERHVARFPLGGQQGLIDAVVDFVGDETGGAICKATVDATGVSRRRTSEDVHVAR